MTQSDWLPEQPHQTDCWDSTRGCQRTAPQPVCDLKTKQGTTIDPKPNNITTLCWDNCCLTAPKRWMAGQTYIGWMVFMP
mmetsp:Transcript_27171/g.46138  ORF Transcript_27171/g.46138 Transcript_27171/m.46138 type:complete len:80 (-) Transcript_27171:2034-2273(-)